MLYGRHSGVLVAPPESEDGPPGQCPEPPLCLIPPNLADNSDLGFFIPDSCAEDLTGEVIERIKKEIPSRADTEFLLEYDEDDYDGYEDGEYEDDGIED